jgi:hypothetical protein
MVRRRSLANRELHELKRLAQDWNLLNPASTSSATQTEHGGHEEPKQRDSTFRHPEAIRLVTRHRALRLAGDQVRFAPSERGLWFRNQSRRRRPQRAASGLSLLRRPTSGAHATAIGRCGPFHLCAGIWKRFHMFTTDDPELARSPGRWLELTRGPATVGPSQRRRAVIPDLEMAKATAASVGPEPRQQRAQRGKPCRPCRKIGADSLESIAGPVSTA